MKTCVEGLYSNHLPKLVKIETIFSGYIFGFAGKMSSVTAPEIITNSLFIFESMQPSKIISQTMPHNE